MNTVVQFLMIFFWAIPVGIASTMVSFSELEQKIPFFKNRKKPFISFNVNILAFTLYLFKCVW